MMKNGYFEYYSDEYDSGPIVLNDWTDGFLLFHKESQVL